MRQRSIAEIKFLVDFLSMSMLSLCTLYFEIYSILCMENVYSFIIVFLYLIECTGYTRSIECASVWLALEAGGNRKSSDVKGRRSQFAEMTDRRR